MSPTTTMATLAATVSSAIKYIGLTLIFELLDQAFEFRDVFLGQLPLLAEMRHQRRDATAKQPVQESLAFTHEPLVALKQGRVEITATVFLGADGLFLQEAIQQRLDRRLLPVLP